MSGPGFIKNEKPQQCDLCGKWAELRPYGPNGECICVQCGERDPETTLRRMREYLELDKPVFVEGLDLWI